MTCNHKFKVPMNSPEYTLEECYKYASQGELNKLKDVVMYYFYMKEAQEYVDRAVEWKTSGKCQACNLEERDSKK